MEKSLSHFIPIVIVDDEEGFRSVTARRLGKKGLQPVEMESGEKCLQFVRQHPVSVIVMDVKMPGMNGIDALKQIKQVSPETQVILLTGNAAVSDGIEGMKSGAFDYLTKPVELDHLAGKINQALEMIRLIEEKEKEKAYRRKLEKKMVDTERLVALGTMSTGIAHEINNPLAIINEAAGFMKLVLTSSIKDDKEKTEALLNGIGKIEKSIDRVRKITHQLLGHVKKQAPVCVKTDITKLIRDTFGLLEKEILKKKIKMVLKDHTSSGFIWSDPHQIRQILINLLENAIHASGKKGAIKVDVRESPADMIIEIEDNGVGIPGENIGKIFDPFFTTKSFDEGTGLGLFVVHKIISDLSGNIDVESAAGKGSKFKITLPITGRREKVE